MTATDDPVDPADPDDLRPPSQDPLPDDPDLRRFAAELGGLWQDVSPLAAPRDEAASRELFELMDAVRRQNVAAGLAVSTIAAHAGDLTALRAGWPHFSPGQKAVLNAATAYVLGTGDGTATGGAARDGGGAGDAALSDSATTVVTAAVRAVLHRR